MADAVIAGPPGWPEPPAGTMGPPPGPAATVYAGLGALVVRRARNPIGWFLLGDGGFLAIMALSSAYAVRGVSHPGTLPAAAAAGLLAQWSFVPVVTGVAFMLLLFPIGALPPGAGARSRRSNWWPRRSPWPAWPSSPDSWGCLRQAARRRPS